MDLMESRAELRKERKGKEMARRQHRRNKRIQKEFAWG